MSELCPPLEQERTLVFVTVYHQTAKQRSIYNTVKLELAIEHVESLWLQPTHRMVRPSFRRIHRGSAAIQGHSGLAQHTRKGSYAQTSCAVATSPGVYYQVLGFPLEYRE